MTEMWHRKKFGTPPHSGSLAYCVLQNDPHFQPASPVGTNRFSLNLLGDSQGW